MARYHEDNFLHTIISFFGKMSLVLREKFIICHAFCGRIGKYLEGGTA
ncbi:hypothetical protein HMPREF1992_01819 [Selenomonas sp. oral taxon 892 str. F0426]|nr:hypothetical protein HMPREF1992_01819 [Selenomonas sp. oral taxon 892 str. F0426]